MNSLIMLLMIFCTSNIFAQESNVPASVKANLEIQYPNAKNVKWDKENSNFEAEFEFSDLEQSALFNSEGTLLVIETEIEMSEVPTVVKKTLIRDFEGYENEKPSKLEKNGEIFYKIELKKGDMDFDAIFSADGKLLKKENEEDNNESDDDDENKGNDYND